MTGTDQFQFDPRIVAKFQLQAFAKPKQMKSDFPSLGSEDREIQTLEEYDEDSFSPNLNR